jgi:flagellin FlaB
VAVAYRVEDKPIALDKIRIEIVVPTGAALTVERQVPTISTSIVNLG